MKSAAKERSEVEGNGAIRIQIGRKRPELLFRWKLLPNLVHSSIPEPREDGRRGVDFISLPEPAIFARGGGGMFYNQVRWLEIRAILSNLVPTKPGQAQSRLPFSLPSSFSVYLLPKLIRLISPMDTCPSRGEGRLPKTRSLPCMP